MQDYRIGSVVAASVVLHALLIAYGEHHDAVVAAQPNGGLKYTDIDFHVFSDAARHVAQGESPFNRDTYRYTPLVAWILYPGAAVDILVWGKVVFSAFGVIVGWLTYEIVGLQSDGNGARARSSEKGRVLAAAVWLVNPMVLVVSTRGNAESLLAFLVLATLFFALKRKAVLAGLAFGLAVHFKIYPIVYAAPIYFSFSESEKLPSGGFIYRLMELLRPNAARLWFVAAFATAFSVPTIAFYWIYGQQYLDEAFLYHLSRSDVKHNFSPYFYPMYLLADCEWAARLLSLAAFVPQAAAVVSIALVYSGHRHLPFCMFLQTLAFVALNKVCTSQYFLWYLCLLPTILVRLYTPTPPVRLMAVAAAWVASQAAWLLAAYLLEYRGMQTIFFVWIASLLFLLSNAFAMDFFVRSYIW